MNVPCFGPAASDERPAQGAEPDSFEAASREERHLSHLLESAARERPDRIAVEDERGRTLTYAELAQGADRLATRLARWGTGRGDRVGLWLPKGHEAVSAIYGILRAGAAYIPVDPSGPAVRSVAIFAASGVKAVVVAAPLADSLRGSWTGPGPLPRLILVEDAKGEEPADSTREKPRTIAAGDALWSEVQADDAPSPLPPLRDPDDLAYILFTSGSTGQPKGVMLSHANAFTFLNWCHEALGPWCPDERLSSHAPFHFDLSVFDLFHACRLGATVVLVGEALAKEPVALGDFLSLRRISVWYSAPSILALLATHGAIDRPGAEPRLVLFAGEVFPIGALRKLRKLWPQAQLWNLYGPTETNVCTAQRIPAVISDERTEPYPIGRVCPPLRARVIDEEGCDVPPGARGELVIAGASVMRGYYGQPELTAQAFLTDEFGAEWYRTGDVVIQDDDGSYEFHGRRDRMVKRRGYRIELGEIESALYRHEGVDRAAVVATADDSGLSITAFVALKPEQKKSIIAMKRHCTVYLPHYMVPDTITFVSGLPATSTDKVDYQRLGAMAAAREARP
jgi:amino acid adenylation domain-containing protein